MNFEFIAFNENAAELNGEYNGLYISINFVHGKKPHVRTWMPNEGLTVDPRELHAFTGYMRDLVELRPSPSWPEEVNQVWFEYVNWKRGLDVSENQ